MKNQYQDDRFVTSVDVYSLSDELRYGYKVFRELISQHKKLIIPLHEIHEEEMENKENKNSYITFKWINHKFNSSRYQTITEVAGDIRMLLEEFYKYLGQDHYLFKNAQTLEKIMEQKLALLPRFLRDQCSIEATNVYCNKEFLNQALYGARRRGGTKTSEGTETPIMYQLRQEMEILEKQKRQKKEEERRLKLELMKEQIVAFEKDVLTGQLLKELKTCWEVPCVGILIYMLQDYFDIQTFNYTEFEFGSLFMERSSLFAKIFTALSLTPYQRSRVRDKQQNLRNVPSFKETVKSLNARISKWYSTADDNGVEYALEKFGFCQTFFDSLGEDNPLTDDVESFTQLRLQQKISILKALCEATLSNDEAMCQTLASVPILQRQDLYLGKDNEKNSFYFFPQFNTTDIRMYKKIHIPAKLKKRHENDYELVAWDLQSLEVLIKQMKTIRKSKTSKFYELEQTIEAMYEELNIRADEFRRASEKGKLAFIKDYHADLEDAKNGQVENGEEKEEMETEEAKVTETKATEEKEILVNGERTSEHVEPNGHRELGDDQNMIIEETKEKDEHENAEESSEGSEESEETSESEEEEIIEESEEEIIEESEEEIILSSSEDEDESSK